MNRAEAYTYLDYKDFDYEQGRFFEESLMTSLMLLSAVSPGKTSTLDIDLYSRFPESYGRWINVEQDWMPTIQSTIDRSSSHVVI